MGAQEPAAGSHASTKATLGPGSVGALLHGTPLLFVSPRGPPGKAVLEGGEACAGPSGSSDLPQGRGRGGTGPERTKHLQGPWLLSRLLPCSSGVQGAESKSRPFLEPTGFQSSRVQQKDALCPLCGGPAAFNATLPRAGARTGCFRDYQRQRGRGRCQNSACLGPPENRSPGQDTGTQAPRGAATLTRERLPEEEEGEEERGQRGLWGKQEAGREGPLQSTSCWFELLAPDGPKASRSPSDRPTSGNRPLAPLLRGSG